MTISAPERPILLRRGAWAVTLLPWLGGAIGAVRHGGRDVLRSAPTAASTPTDAACFALVPYANRINAGRFAFGGEDHALRRDPDDAVHSLHGLGWRRAWDVIEVAAERALIEHAHRADAAWPWCYRARQAVAIDDDGVTVTLSVENLSAGVMPTGLGLHPYFPVTPSTRLRMVAASVWLCDEMPLPSVPGPADHFGDWARGGRVGSGGLIDNAYAGWSGAATIAEPDRTILLSARGCGWIHLYRPPNAGFFCLEPVTHMPDAVNRPAPDAGVIALAPGCTTDIAMRVAIA